MSIYVKQINDMLEQLPESEQQFILDLIKVTIDYLERTKRIKRKHITLKERLEDYNGNYIAEEWDTGEPVGEEIF